MGFSDTYTLFSPSGMEVALLAFGASVASIRTADRHGAFANIALALKDLADISCAGATLAPYAGRIAGGRMDVDGIPYQLSLNEGKNHNHGGFHSLRDRAWRFEGMSETAAYQQIVFSADLEDSIDGYPGNRHFTATYRLHHQALEILLTAEADRPTRVNLSNHTYFNLSGDFTSDVSCHLLELDAGEVYINDDAFLMIARRTPPDVLDFSRMREIGTPCDHPQIARAKGLNHCYPLLKSSGKPAATLICPASGRRMRLHTDQPCLMLYSGGYLDTPNCAITLEAVEHPLSPCAKDRPPVLYPGETYRRRIVYQFDTV